MKVVSFIEPPQPEVIEAILKHCGLWQSRSPRAPPEVDELVLELDAAYSSSSIDPPDQADQSQELSYVDIDTFLANFSRIPDADRHGTMRPSRGIALYFACIALPFVLRNALASGARVG